MLVGYMRRSKSATEMLAEELRNRSGARTDGPHAFVPPFWLFFIMVASASTMGDTNR